MISAPPLGSIARSSTKLLDGRQSAIRRRFRHQSAVRKLLPHERVSDCCWTPVPDAVGIDVVQYDNGSTGYQRLQQCNSVWACPVCAARIGRERHEQAQKTINGSMMDGYHVVMATLTMRHSAYDTAPKLLESMLGTTGNRKGTAWDKLISGGRWSRFCKKYGYVGRIRSLEVTHGENGWHPHLHILLVLEDKADLEDLWYDLAHMWLDALERVGRDGEAEAAVHVTDADKDIADYIAKWGREPKADNRWGAARELTSQTIKRANEGGRTPAQLLELYSDMGDKKAGALFKEYALAFKGERQIVISQGLRKLYLTDDDSAGDDDDEFNIMATLSRSLWNDIRAMGLRGELLEAASESAEQLKTFLREYNMPDALPISPDMTPPPPSSPGSSVTVWLSPPPEPPPPRLAYYRAIGAVGASEPPPTQTNF